MNNQLLILLTLHGIVEILLSLFLNFLIDKKFAYIHVRYTIPHIRAEGTGI